MFLITDPWAAGSECGWENVCTPGEKSFFLVLTFVKDLDNLGQEVKFSELLITEDQRGWEQTSQWTPLLPSPLSVPRWNAQPKVMNPSLCSLCWLLLSFFDSLQFAQCHSLGGKDQQNKIKSPLHLQEPLPRWKNITLFPTTALTSSWRNQFSALRLDFFQNQMNRGAIRASESRCKS